MTKPLARQAQKLTGTALVTGACSGIGLEIARELARRGQGLVLVSDRKEVLLAVSKEMSARYGVPVDVVPMDLARPQAASELYAEVARRGHQVDILVSNAGFLLFGEVAEAPPDRVDALLQLHVVTPSLLARLFGRDMRERRHGHILFVSSLAAFREFPGIAVYGSSKRYLLSFAKALREELRPWGVRVTCLAPGAVATGLYPRTAVPVAKAIKYRVMHHPAQIAQTAVEAMFRGKAVVVPGLSARLLGWLMRLTPHWLIKMARERSGLLPMPEDSKE